MFSKLLRAVEPIDDYYFDFPQVDHKDKRDKDNEMRCFSKLVSFSTFAKYFDFNVMPRVTGVYLT